MPETITKTSEGQIIGGTFSSREKADKAIKAFRELGVLASNITEVAQAFESPAKDASSDLLSDRGFAQSQTDYYEKAVREGKIVVAVYGVVDPAPIIDIFDRYGAEYNPSGSRNLRQDVAGMTAGAVIGAAAGGVAGAVVGGPVGAAAGVAAGAVIGGGSGAAAGKAVEHKK